MADMLSYSTQMLHAISEWLLTPPVNYVVGLMLVTFVVSIIMMIIRPYR